MRKPATFLSPRRTRLARLVTVLRTPLRTSGLLSLVALGVASPLAVVSLLGLSAVAGQPHAFGVAPGVSDFGQTVPAATGVVALAGAAPAHGLQLRRGCRWGQPGRAPYQGSTRQALQAAGLPEDVVAQIEAQRQQAQPGHKGARLAITREGIRHTTDGRVFPARGFALTYGMTLCRDSSVNFVKGHVEMADLYEARDAQGRPYAVMVPDVCGNVSVLAMPGAQGKVAGVAASLARRAAAMAALADALDPSGAAGAGAGAAGAAPHRVAEGSGADGAGVDQGGAEGAVRHPGPMRVGDYGTAAGATHAAAGDDPTNGHRAPLVLATIGAVGAVLMPAQVAGGVVRELGRVTAAAGRGLESLSPTPGAPGPAGSAGGAGGAGNTQAVPEPGSLWAALLALAALGAVRWRRRQC